MSIGPGGRVAVPPIAMAPSVQGACIFRMVEAQCLVLDGMDVSSTPRGKEHLNAHDDKHRCHGDEAGGGRIALVPEARQTWVGERLEGGGQEVDKGRGDQDAGAEVSGEEEERVGDGEAGKALDDDGEGARCDSQSHAGHADAQETYPQCSARGSGRGRRHGAMCCRRLFRLCYRTPGARLVGEAQL